MTTSFLESIFFVSRLMILPILPLVSVLGTVLAATTASKQSKVIDFGVGVLGPYRSMAIIDPSAVLNNAEHGQLIRALTESEFNVNVYAPSEKVAAPTSFDFVLDAYAQLVLAVSYPQDPAVFGDAQEENTFRGLALSALATDDRLKGRFSRALESLNTESLTPSPKSPKALSGEKSREGKAKLSLDLVRLDFSVVESLGALVKMLDVVDDASDCGDEETAVDELPAGIPSLSRGNSIGLSLSSGDVTSLNGVASSTPTSGLTTASAQTVDLMSKAPLNGLKSSLLRSKVSPLCSERGIVAYPVRVGESYILVVVDFRPELPKALQPKVRVVSAPVKTPTPIPAPPGSNPSTSTSANASAQDGSSSESGQKSKEAEQNTLLGLPTGVTVTLGVTTVALLALMFMRKK